jgi:pimeloyl-ACP methyl ester carboxylesterase
MTGNSNPVGRMKFLPFLIFTLLTSCAQAPTFKKTSTPVVFLHGSHFSVDVWRDVIKNWPQNQERTFLTLAIPNRLQGEGLALPEVAVVMAHSYGGLVAQHTVGICPEKLKQIIYVAAMTALPKEDGFKTFSLADQNEYGRAVSKESLTGGTEPATYDLNGWPKIRKAYILTKKDLMMSPATQAKFMDKGQTTTVHEIDSGHLPMVTHALALAVL